MGEHGLQCACFQWFSYQYPMYEKLYYAIPNGGKRNVVVATKLKREGVKAGVLDSFLAIPRYRHNGLYIEFKYGKNKMSDLQKEFAYAVQKQGYKVETVYTLEEFINQIKSYLS